MICLDVDFDVSNDLGVNHTLAARGASTRFGGNRATATVASLVKTVLSVNSILKSTDSVVEDSKELLKGIAGVGGLEVPASLSLVLEDVPASGVFLSESDHFTILVSVSSSVVPEEVDFS